MLVIRIKPEGEIPPFQMTLRVVAQDQYGHSHIQTLNVFIEVISRLTSWLSSPDTPLPLPPGTLRPREAVERAALLDAMIATLTDSGITSAVADLADVNPILVPPPANPLSPQCHGHGDG